MAGPVPNVAAPSPDAPNGGGHGRLTLYILIAIVAALAFAWVKPEWAAATAIGGEVFLNLLFMLVVPLVVTSVMGGVLGMGDVRKLGRPGLWTLTYFLGTTAVAVAVGLVVTNVMRPGEGVVSAAQRHAAAQSTDEKAVQARERAAARQAAAERLERAEQELREALAARSELLKRPEQGLPLGGPDLVRADAAVESAQKKVEQARRELDKLTETGWTILEGLVRMLFTKNLIASAANADLLPLIGFSLLFAAVLTTLGPRTADLNRLILQANDALMAVVLLIMKVAPLGIFCLVASRFGEAASGGREKLLDLFAQTGWYMTAVLIGLAVHAFGVLPLLYWLFRRRNPFAFVGHMAEALLTAFSTASSTATVPVTLEAAVTKAGVSRRAADFVIPLGATVNMNGTALYEAAAALFIAQALGRDLGLADQLIVAVTATLAAVGAAGIPEAGLVTMLIVLGAVGLPVEMMALIVPVDWLLDRFRTAVNVFGDAVGAAVVERAMPAE